jgi:hypothetical protein
VPMCNGKTLEACSAEHMRESMSYGIESKYHYTVVYLILYKICIKIKKPLCICKS